MAQIQMLDDDNPADFEWIVLADGGARDAFEIELEATRKFLSIPNGQWAVHYYEKGGANVLCQVRCILEKHPVQISGRPRVFWSLYDEPDGHALCSLLETLSHSFHVIAPKSWAFAVSTAKTAMKRQFMACGVPTAPFCTSPFDTDEEFGGVPWFVKMDVGASAVGITLENKVTTPDSMKAAWSRVETMGYGVFAEHFIRGRECTVVVCGPVESPTIFAPMERIFKEGLDGHEIDEVWDNYTWETTKPEVDPWAAAAKVLALDAYRAMRATPYARVDIRDKFVLEVFISFTLIPILQPCLDLIFSSTRFTFFLLVKETERYVVAYSHYSTKSYPALLYCVAFLH